MPTPAPEAIALGRAYRLALGFDPQRGAAGEHLAKGGGSSLEFQDRRAYVAGDDVRHVDWNALARTGQIMVRQYREEVLPQLELILDTSSSMEVEESKAALAIDLAGLICGSAAGQGLGVRVILLGDRVERMGAQAFLERGLAFSARRPLQDSLREAQGLLQPGGVRLLISDFLSPHSPRELLGMLARGPGALALLQVLGSADLDPPEDLPLRLMDAESGEHLDLVLDGSIRRRYLRRLQCLIEGLGSACARQAALHVELDAGRPLAELCRDRLLPKGFLAPA